MSLSPTTLALLGLAACGGPPATTAEDTAASLDDVALATRISLDLRGVRPSADELRLVAVDPRNLDALTEGWLADPRLGDRAAWLWNESLHTALWFEDYGRFGPLEFDEWRSMGAEPLALIAAVVEEDRPFSEIVTADALPADPTLAALWDMAHPGGDGWEPSLYQDGRPMAGLLSSTSLWNRYNADITNRNRLRANTVARALLCADFFDRDVDFDFDLGADALASVESAVTTEPSCLACHAALDPLAAFFGGFTERSQAEPIEQYRSWSPWTDAWYAAWTPPAYYGHPGADLTDLGAMIAADPRFSTCAARRFAEGMIGAPLDSEAAEALGERFRGADLVARDLLRDIVALDAYAAADDRLLSPEQLRSSLAEALAWDVEGGAEDGLAPLVWDVELRVLAGGADDDTVLLRNREPGLALHASLAWAARTAVEPAIAADLSRGEGDRRMFGVPGAYDAAGAAPEGEDALRAQLAALRARFLSELVADDSDEVDGMVALWQAAGGDADPDAAWAAVLSGLVRHPRAVMY